MLSTVSVCIDIRLVAQGWRDVQMVFVSSIPLPDLFNDKVGAFIPMYLGF